MGFKPPKKRTFLKPTFFGVFFVKIGCYFRKYATRVSSLMKTVREYQRRSGGKDEEMHGSRGRRVQRRERKKTLVCMAVNYRQQYGNESDDDGEELWDEGSWTGGSQLQLLDN